MLRTVWLYQSETILRQKSDGKLMMISDFVMEKGTDRLILPRELWGNRPHSSAMPGVSLSQASTWTIGIRSNSATNSPFDEAFPGETALFVFDNSSAHGCYATDPLRAEDELGSRRQCT